MAIIKGIDGLEVTIKVGDEIAKEYDPSDDGDGDPPEELKFHIPTARSEADGPPYVAKYIEAKPGAPFEIHVTRLPNFKHHGHHIMFFTTADGQQLHGNRDKTVTAHKKNTTWVKVKKGRSFYNQEKETWQKCSFQFGALCVDEDTDLAPEVMKQQLAKSEKLGLLRVEFFHMQHGRRIQRPPGESAHHNDPITGIDKISEKALKGKALDAQVIGGTVKDVKRWSNTCTHNIFKDPSKRPFAVFDFRYRTMDGLMKSGIVPRPVEAEHLTAAGQLAETMSEAEARRLARELLEMREPRIKREREEVEPMSDAAFAERYKARRLASGRLEVDLTDD